MLVLSPALATIVSAIRSERDSQHLAQTPSSSTPPRIHQSRVEKAILRCGIFHPNPPAPEQGWAVLAGVDCSGARSEAETMVALYYFPSVRVDRIPPERPGKRLDGPFCPRRKLARAVADLPLQSVRRKPD